MNTTDKRSPAAKLRALLAEPGILVTPGVFDGFSLRLVEQMGYKHAAISGAGVSESCTLPIGSLPASSSAPRNKSG